MSPVLFESVEQINNNQIAGEIKTMIPISTEITTLSAYTSNPTITATTTSISTSTHKTTTTTTTSTTNSTTPKTTTTTTINKTYLYYASSCVYTQIFNNNPIIQDCRNFDTATINSFQYNLVFDSKVGVYLYDSNWNYKSTFPLTDIFYGIVGNNYYYFSLLNSYGIIKTSLTSPIDIKSYGSVGNYRGLYYDSAGSKILAAGCDISRVDVLDLDLNFKSSVSFQGQCPRGVIVYNAKIYVALKSLFNSCFKLKWYCNYIK